MNERERALEVDRRILERRKQQEKRGIALLWTACAGSLTTLLLVLYTAVGSTRLYVGKMAGTMLAETETGQLLLGNGAGSYVLVAVLSFVSAVLLTILCYRIREQKKEEK